MTSDTKKDRAGCCTSKAPDRPKPSKLHWWSKCPCGSGRRFGKCCGASGADTCRYE